ncbi:LacI family transcriptional regulator [Amycolatopsis thermoflava]|uniref:LacI family transcriptional regulator n=1 Tax=Amycolatopsis thermoflava TaxID=84480 RepID=A0A3N2H367_9PSEU|nr:LacI family transcriptional regulator [Amycolatopsis thermoflava]
MLRRNGEVPRVAATIKDVAALAGVSISTVSLAINGSNRVRPETRERVLAAADQLEFVPRTEAVARARRGVRRIGVMAPFTSYPTFARRLEGVLLALRDHGWEVVVFDQESAASALPTLASIPLTNKLDGLLVMSLPIDDATARRLLRQNLATVLVEAARTGFSSVGIDHAEGGRLAAGLLLERGHTRFAFIGERKLTSDVVLPPESRLSAYRETLRIAGYPLEDQRIITVPHQLEAARQAAVELLSSEPRPTAVFAQDDLLAAGVLKAARERDLRIPEDLAVIGFDDGDVAEALGLTTIRQPLLESGEVAARTLVAQLGNPDRSLQEITLKLTLVERATT